MRARFAAACIIALVPATGAVAVGLLQGSPDTVPTGTAPPAGVPTAAAAASSPSRDSSTEPPAAADAPAHASPKRMLPALDGCRWIPAAPADAGSPRIVVIDLWGPWSSDSMTYMPRLSRIAREHASDGVAVRGITREMPGWSAERIEESVRKLGGRVTYPVAIAPANLHAQISALPGDGSPADTLVFDSTGTLVAACSPAELEHALSRLLAGTWTGQHEIDAIRRETRAMDSLVKISMSDPALAASQVEAMIAMHPHRMRDFASRRIVILLRAGLADEAAAAMRSSTDEWTRLQDAAELTALATVWMDSRTNASAREMGLAASAAEAAAVISGDLDPNPWLLLMRARVAAGDSAGARAAGERAMAIGDERMRGRIEQLLAKIPKQPEAGDAAGQQPE